jgi:MFS transporter, MHS family, proline/betaine transporter
MSHIKNQIAGTIGNLLESYDNALFSLLAPFIAPLFFEKDPLTALILTYGMLPLGFLTKPLGALCFGWIEMRFGKTKALSFSLLGMAITTSSFGFLPTCQTVGILAPYLLACIRMLQGFFIAGGKTGGAIFVLEHTKQVEKRGLLSSLYDASTLGGVLIASAAITYMSSKEILQTNWRFAFFAGGATAFICLFLRGKATDQAPLQKRQNPHFFSLLSQHKTPLVSIILASGFSHMTYQLAFTFMNGYLPLVTSLKESTIMQVNTAFLLLDMALLPCFGYLTYRVKKEKIMMLGAFGLALFSLPLLQLLNHASLGTSIAVRVCIIVFGIAFAAPYHAWAIEQTSPSHRYLILSLGSALGSQCIGAPTAALCLWLYKITNWSFAPAFYLALVGLSAGIILYKSSVKIKSTH